MAGMTGGYATIGVEDPAKSYAFYDAVFAAIGWGMHIEFSTGRGYSRGGGGEGFTVWTMRPFNGEPATFGNGSLVGFMVDTRAEVEAFHEAALAHGGTDEGAPGPRAYEEHWYAAYVRDPLGNKLSAVCLAAPE
ncbi:MAG: VOC family protein [Parvularculaceae bacterium]|nr:VOC family protein [Parvularculaceae bacterium]